MKSIPFWVAGFLLLSGADGCHGLSKKAGAPEASTEVTTDTTSSSCAGFASYVTYAEPALQARCIGCHASGQSGSNKYALSSGTFTSTDLQAVANYVASKAKTTSANCGSPDSNTLINRPFGTNHQQIFFDFEDSNYLAILQWIADECASPCE